MTRPVYATREMAQRAADLKKAAYNSVQIDRALESATESVEGCLHRRFGPMPSLRTFPSRFPVFALDRIWVQPRASLLDVRVHRTPLARRASDHLPLTARVRLEGREPVRR